MTALKHQGEGEGTAANFFVTVKEVEERSRQDNMSGAVESPCTVDRNLEQEGE